MELSKLEQAFIDSLPGRAGWKKIGQRQATRRVTRPVTIGGVPSPTQTETVDELVPNQYVWFIIGPNGQPDELTVRENRTNPDDPLPLSFTLTAAPTQTPVKPPAPAAPETKDFVERQPDGTLVRRTYIWDPDA